MNLAPVIGSDGTVYTVSTAHLGPINVYLISINPYFTLKWTTSLQNVVPDGCGVLVPISDHANIDPNSCRNGATIGVDPVTNLFSSATVADEASSSPTVLPDGSILFATPEDGNIYAIPQGGKNTTNLFLKQAVGAAYTPLAIGPDGKFYTQNDGHLFVVGN